MTKSLKRILLVALVFCMTVVCAVFAAACNNGDESGNPENGGKKEEQTESYVPDTAPEVTSSSGSLVLDGDPLTVTFSAGEAKLFIFGANDRTGGEQLMLGLFNEDDTNYSGVKNFAYFCNGEKLSPPAFGPKVMFALPDELPTPPIMKIIVVAPTNLGDDVTLHITLTIQDYDG